jgi:mannose/cellobiose epimerase-like protein (N-acyl-D-glucosamine 2-epimerase family)
MKPDTCHDWQPLLLDRISIEALRAPGYRRFILDAAIVPGCRLLLARHQRRPGWPYVETKFNPNTGCDLPAGAYNIVHTWFLGRGSEALDDHLRILDTCDALTADERAASRTLFLQWIDNMTQTLGELAERYRLDIPFRVNRALAAVDAQGEPLDPATLKPDASGIFCAKGLMSSRNPALQSCGLQLLRRAAARIRRNEPEQSTQTPGVGGVGQGTRMLMQGAGACFARKALDPAARAEALELAADMLGEVLDRHHNPETSRFSEYCNAETGQPEPYLDPGHAAELAGLGLGMIEQLERSSAAARHAVLISRARRELPRILLQAVALGYNPRHPGLFKGVNNRTGEPMNTEMPWWNLPETMRAAVRAYAVADSESIRIRCLEAFRLCHNAYFSHYPNRDNLLFPYQTLDGHTGKVLDVVPAVPEGDPLYHANGAFLDMLEVLEKLR